MEIVLMTIRQTAKELHLPETMLRRMLKQGCLPGIYSATRFYVNVPKLAEKINSQAAG